MQENSFYYIKIGDLYLGENGYNGSMQLVASLSKARKFYYSDGDKSVKYDVSKECEKILQKGLSLKIYKRELVETYTEKELLFGDGGLVEKAGSVLVTTLTPEELTALQDALAVNNAPTTYEIVGSLHDEKYDITGLGLVQTVKDTGVVEYKGILKNGTESYADENGSAIGMAIYYKLPVGAKDIVLTNGVGVDDYSESTQYYDETKGYVKFTKNIVTKPVDGVYTKVEKQTTVWHVSYTLDGKRIVKDVTLDISGVIVDPALV